MAVTAPLQHLQTFARLRQASAGDLDDLLVLQQSLSPRHAIAVERWRHLIESRAARVTLAIEGGVIVGVAVELHRVRSPIAQLMAMGVTPSARGRGIGHLLIEVVITQARAEGAAMLWAEAPADQSAMRRLLEGAGFAMHGHTEGTTVRYGKSLWNQRQSIAQAHAQHEPAFYPHDGQADTGACSLIMAMATLDRAIMLTPRLETVLNEEASLPLSAVRRGFRVTLYPGAEAGAARAFEDFAAGMQAAGVATLRTQPSPEQLIGYLSRGYLPMLHCRFPRLHRHKAPHWLLLAGFDGFLFRIVDPQLPHNPANQLAVTLGELRACLREATPSRPAVMVLSKQS